MRVLVMGPPGAGSRTQGERLAQHLRVPAIVMSEVFKNNAISMIALGRQAKTFTEAGRPVPDRIIDEMVRDRLAQNDARYGWVMAGYPRTLAHAAALDRLSVNCGVTLDLVIAIGVPEPELMRRLSVRASRQGLPPRSVDEFAVQQQAYKEDTDPCLTVYHRRSLLQVVDGRGEVCDVDRRILKEVMHARGIGARREPTGSAAVATGLPRARELQHDRLVAAPPESQGVISGTRAGKALHHQ